jgi:formylmethanofuran dehydrogenase subunit E
VDRYTVGREPEGELVKCCICGEMLDNNDAKLTDEERPRPLCQWCAADEPPEVA